MKTIISFLSIALVVYGCNSDTAPDPVPDYRDVFVGEYTGTRTNSTWALNGPSTSIDMADTLTVTAVGDSSVVIDNTESFISVDGAFFEQGNGGASNIYSVQFSSPNRLQTDVNSGGNGGGYHSTFRGQKN